MKLNRVSFKLNAIIQFSLRLPKLYYINILKNYHRWFDISSKPLKKLLISKFLNKDL